MSDLLKTPLYAEHEALGARIVDFGGWALPVNYGSQVDEHHAVRRAAGMFDVSHMTVSDLTGDGTLDFLGRLLANDISKTEASDGKALYSCMLNPEGGVIDDLIVYRLNNQHCRLITNAATNQKDMAWIASQAEGFDVQFTERPELALIAVQGPEAIKHFSSLPLFNGRQQQMIAALKRFQGCFIDDSVFVGRTGYTGEDGVEVVLPGAAAKDVWQALLQAGVQPCGLGARDTLRLEAGMSLYGNDLDENHTPFESGIGWSVSMQGERDFIGRKVLERPARFKMVGIVLEDRGVIRGHQTVMWEGNKIGEITSGTFSPTLERSIGLARIMADASCQVGDLVQIEVRNKLLAARLVNYPFVKAGKAAI